MTNKEAVKLLSEFRQNHTMYGYEHSGNIDKAVDMAIMALETSCDNCPLDAENNYNSAENNHISETTKEVEIKSENNEPYFKNELISRKAVLDMLNKIDKAVEDGEGYQYKEWVDYVEELPTIPQTNLTLEQAIDRFDRILTKYAEIQTNSVMRNATKEEQESVNDYIKSISVKMVPVTVLEEIRAEIENERTGYPPSADYYKAIKKAVRIIEKHIRGKE